MADLPEHVLRNRAAWNELAAEYEGPGRAISEYGACIWCDPYLWVPEAARLLRPGGELIFMVGSVLALLCDPDEGDDVPADDRLHRPYFDQHRVEWEGEDAVEFRLNHGDWISLLREHGFEVERLIEVRPADGSTTRYPHITLEWAQRWPCEEIWKCRATLRA